MVVDRRLREADLKRHVAHRNACIPVAGEKPQRDFKGNVRMLIPNASSKGEGRRPERKAMTAPQIMTTGAVVSAQGVLEARTGR